MTKKDEVRDLLTRYREGRLSPEEKRLLDAWYNRQAADSQHQLTRDEIEDTIRSLSAGLPLGETRVKRLWPRIVAAASILIAISAGGYLFLHHKEPVQQQTAQNQIHDIPPGSNKAILTLSNGQKISLTDAKNGNIAKQANASITKTSNGRLVYLVNSSAAAEVAYNTVSTPVSGQHEITLSDGTEVMLDAQSSITFPVTFTGKERKVSMTGQAYFIVKHNARQPFLVSVKGQTIRDIGTEFNVNAYDDETTVKTTLVSGSVKVNNTLIKPGQQAIGTTNNIKVEEADTAAIVAWKDGNFIFRHQDLETTMRQLARWYNVQVVYDNAPQNLRIGGKVSRERPLSVVLAAMEQTGEIKFKLNGRILTVTQ